VASRILLIEDDARLAAMLAEYLGEAGYRTAVAATGAAGLQMAAQQPFDALVLDLMLPDMDGLDVCRQLRATRELPILMLTARGDAADRIVGLEIGADDYVVKPFSSAEVIARIRAVLRRTGRTAAPEAADDELAVEDVRVDVAARRAWRGEEELELSRREFDLLARLMRDAGRVVTREALMDDVWDVNWFGSTKTLDVHVGWLRRKLGDDPQAPRYIHTVRGVGFRFSDATA